MENWHFLVGKLQKLLSASISPFQKCSTRKEVNDPFCSFIIPDQWYLQQQGFFFSSRNWKILNLWFLRWPRKNVGLPESLQDGWCRETEGGPHLIYADWFIKRALCSRGNCVGGDASWESCADSFSHLLRLHLKERKSERLQTGNTLELYPTFSSSLLLSSAPVLLPYQISGVVAEFNPFPSFSLFPYLECLCWVSTLIHGSRILPRAFWKCQGRKLCWGRPMRNNLQSYCCVTGNGFAS